MKIEYHNHTDSFFKEARGPESVKFIVDPGKWYKAPIILSEASEISRMYIPIIPGRKIVARLEYRGNLETRDQDSPRNWNLKPEGWRITFPRVNPLFHSRNLRDNKNGVYTFATEAIPTAITQLGGLEQFRNAIPPDIKRDYIVNQKDLAFKLWAAIKFQEDTLEETLERVLKEVNSCCLGIQADDEAFDLFHEDNLGSLLAEIRRTRTYTGTCKARSTYTVGLLNAMGIAARREAGLIATKPRDNGGLHTWTEIFIHGASQNLWVPIDADWKVNRVIPPQYEYAYETDVPKLEGKETTFRFNIDYE